MPQFYLVFEAADGGELFDRLVDRGRFTEADECGTIRSVLEAVAYMHQNNIVHRDIKPENILYRTPAEDANIVLVDFGVAAHLRGKDDRDLKGMCGSVGYAAPEVIFRKGHGKPVDMWGLGIVTYAMLSGYVPFSSADPALFKRQLERGKVEFNEKYWGHVSASAQDFVKRCLEKDPDKRITAEEALQHPWFQENLEAKPDSADVSAGLRENYKSRWKSAITAVRASQKFKHAGEHAREHSETGTSMSLYSDNDEVMDDTPPAASAKQNKPEENPTPAAEQPQQHATPGGLAPGLVTPKASTPGALTPDTSSIMSVSPDPPQPSQDEKDGHWWGINNIMTKIHNMFR